MISLTKKLRYFFKLNCNVSYKYNRHKVKKTKKHSGIVKKENEIIFKNAITQNVDMICNIQLSTMNLNHRKNSSGFSNFKQI